jgi:hypothetical protein
VAEEAEKGAIPFTAGDNEQSDGRYVNYMLNFHPFWGSLLDKLLAVPGNHDYHDYQAPGADDYFRYFGTAADPDGTKTGWYLKRFPFATFVALNSNVDMLPDSEQVKWLRRTLSAEPTPCTMAVWHHPRWSSGRNGDNPKVQELWNALYDAGVDVIVNGHDHWIERMKPQRPNGTPDAARGIRQFTAGGGGAALYELKKLNPNSEFRLAAHSVIRPVFRARSYGWQYLGLDRTVLDSDLGVPAEEKQCH